MLTVLLLFRRLRAKRRCLGTIVQWKEWSRVNNHGHEWGCANAFGTSTGLHREGEGAWEVVTMEVHGTQHLPACMHDRLAPPAVHV